jgi:multiple sugar transport system substrate-binding protein
MKLTRVVTAAAVAVMATSLVACSSGSSGSGSGSSAQAGSGSGTIAIWAHQGQDSENAAVQAAVDGFNASQTNVKATLRLLSGDTYTSTVTNTPADKLPDVLEMDGPTMASYVYNNKLSPLTGLVSQATIDNATPGSVAEGTSGDKLYGLAIYDSAMGLWGNKKMLDDAGIKYPTSFDTAWTADEFAAALKKLAATAVNDLLAPVRARRAEYERDLGYVRQVLRDGNERASEIAAVTLAEVRAAMGMTY